MFDSFVGGFHRAQVFFECFLIDPLTVLLDAPTLPTPHTPHPPVSAQASAACPAVRSLGGSHA